ncbi:hypothetical protein H2198_000102 [Neophaeococcomyces mojaviensis]|uniref:Uncharacterized protein n=1 Tax=Neophaeococcomyces mojaviensis TaxID=3383035 RepID=A0ACC3ALC2_9EURO|nr:hypothetical protein H2198_000102 [Knufia sp. JES_112]
MRPSIPISVLVAIVQASPLQNSIKDDGQHPIKPSPPSSAPVSPIPSVGLGLWNSKPSDVPHAIASAFSSNYTHLDGAAAYNNEPSVGSALSDKHAPARHTYWLTSKLWNTMHKPVNVPKAFNKTLSDLNTTYLDLYLMHWPVAFLPDNPGRTIIDQDTSITDTWRAMETLASAYQASNGAYGAHYIGISNFSPRQIDEILKMCTICPYAHEFETHPYLQQQEFVNWHIEHDMKVIAYSPLANLNPTYKDVMPELPPILEDKFWVGAAQKKNVSVAQAVLGWNVQRGAIVIPKSVHAKRIEENLGALKVEFSEEELQDVQKEDKKIRFNNPSKDWGVELFEGLDGGSNRFVIEDEL